MISTGIDVFLANPTVSGSVGLLTNTGSLTPDGHTILRALRESTDDSGIDVSAIFAPEHGYFGVGAAGESITDSYLGDTPIYSLYGENFSPPIEVLRDLSAVLIDLQDAGTRWYTFLTTIRNMLTACAEAQTPVVLLDRPNPQGGIVVEGMLAEPEFLSIVAPAEMPIRYGLTIGEATSWLNGSIGAALTVIRMDGWKRDMLFSDTGLRWSSPSPNMPSAKATLLYTGTCLIEGLNVSEGRGTALPFEQIGAPYVDAEEFCDEMRHLQLPGLVFTPTWFRPTTSKFTGQVCAGVRIHAEDERHIHGFALGLHLVDTLRRMYADDATWLDYEGRLIFDTLTSTPRIREALEYGQTVEEILALAEAESSAFQSETAAHWLYE